MSEHILKRHNKDLALYHFVCPAKYLRKVFTENIENSLKQICFEISMRYEIYFVEIGADKEDQDECLGLSLKIMTTYA